MAHFNIGPRSAGGANPSPDTEARVYRASGAGGRFTPHHKRLVLEGLRNGETRTQIAERLRSKRKGDYLIEGAKPGTVANFFRTYPNGIAGFLVEMGLSAEVAQKFVREYEEKTSGSKRE